MDTLSLIKSYELELSQAQSALTSFVDTLISRDQTLLIDCLSVIETAKVSNTNLSKIDKIDEDFQEIQSKIELIEKIQEFHHSLKDLNTTDPQQALKKYKKNLQTLQNFPILQSTLLNDLQTLLELQQKSMISLIKSSISAQFIKSPKEFLIFPEFWVNKKILEDLKQWNDSEYSSQIVEFYKETSNQKYKIKVLVGKSILIARKTQISSFHEKIENIQKILDFFQDLLKNSEDLRREFTLIIEEFTKIQAEKCIDDNILKQETIFIVKSCQSSLNAYGFCLDLVKIVENSKDFLLDSLKKSVLGHIRRVLLEPYTIQHPTETCLITKNLQNFLELIQSSFTQPQTTNYEKFFILSTIKEALILFQAFRSINIQPESKILAFLISDTEYLLTKLTSFSEFKQNYPEHLHYLLDFSDISAILSTELIPFYTQLVKLSQNEVIKKCEPFDFSQFEENFSQQEAILLRVLSYIRKSDVKTVLSPEIHCKLLGQIIDTLINETVDRVLILKNIYIKDFQLIKHFFDKIFEIRDIFSGQNPTKFCIQWDKLEALLEIIEGRLIDIISAYQRNRYQHLFTLKQLRRLIKALFEDNEKRKNALKVLI